MKLLLKGPSTLLSKSLAFRRLRHGGEGRNRTKLQITADRNALKLKGMVSAFRPYFKRVSCIFAHCSLIALHLPFNARLVKVSLKISLKVFPDQILNG